MRFAPARGQLGILCHRGYGDKTRIVQRCHDAAADGHGYIIAIDDDDLKVLVEARKQSPESVVFKFFTDRFLELL